MKKLILIFLIWFCYMDAAGAQVEGHAGGYLLNNVRNAGFSFLAFKTPRDQVDKWPYRFNPFFGADIGGNWGNHIKLGTMITIYQNTGFNNERLMLSLLPAYMNFNLDENSYNTPVGILLQYTDRPVSFTALTSWYRNGTTIQIILAWQFGNKENCRL